MTDTQADLTERARARDDGSVYVTLPNLPGFHFIMDPGEGVGPLLEALDQFVALYRQSEREAAAAGARTECERVAVKVRDDSSDPTGRATANLIAGRIAALASPTPQEETR